jgi:hypothetical protein
VKKTLWIFGAAALLLVLVVAGMKIGERAANREGYVFDTTQVAEVVRVRVIYQRDTAELTRENGRWIGVRTGATADAERMQRALTGLLGIRAREKVSESNDPSRLDEFGIGPADAKQVEWTLASGEKFRVLLGKTSGTDFNSTYWKWEDKPGVYSTPGDFTFDLASQEFEWTAGAPAPAFIVK